MVYESKLIDPGYYIEKAKLSTALPQGTIRLHGGIHSSRYGETDDELGTAAAKVTLNNTQLTGEQFDGGEKKREEKKKKKGLIVIIILLIAIVAAPYGIYPWCSSRKTMRQSSNRHWWRKRTRNGIIPGMDEEDVEARLNAIVAEGDA